MNFIEKRIKNNGRIKFYFLGIPFFSYKPKLPNFMQNVFKTSFDKNVLISYIVEPFVRKIHQRHTNVMECYTAAEIFRDMGYNVDVVGWQYNYSGDVSKYNVCYGFGKTYNKLLDNNKIVSVLYGTGCSFYYSNFVTLKKMTDFYKKSGCYAYSSVRYVDDDTLKPLFLSDLIIPLGNDFTAKTYRVDGGCENIKNISSFFYGSHAIEAGTKDFSKIKHNFLWFGSASALHKGLDTVIEIFSRRKDINLYICGAKSSEKEFFAYYEDALTNKIDNIHNMGFVDLDSQDFRDLMNNCAACVFPSLSEGGAPALITVMGNGGLVPIASKASGIDIGQYGFVYEDINESETERKINEFLCLSDDELKALAVRIQQETQQRYTYENYKKNLKEIISSFLESQTAK